MEHQGGRPRPASLRHRSLVLLSTGLLAAVLTTAAARAADDIVIGASIPMSGPLAGFGSYERWGYQRAVDDLNRAGGIAIGGTKRHVKLILRDDKTDPNATASNVETLISRDKAIAILGSCTPALVNAGALVADRHKTPFVTACAPLGAFKAAHKWRYAWDLFFDERDLANATFRLIAENGLQTNGNVAILHDNGPDGQAVGGEIWPKIAADAGLKVVQNTTFPVDNAQFTSSLAEAKGKGAEILLVDAITPQAIAIRKQMAASAFVPKLLVMEKGAEPAQFEQAAGKLADGVIVAGYWDPSFPYPHAKELAAAFETETKLTSSQHIADT